MFAKTAMSHAPPIIKKHPLPHTRSEDSIGLIHFIPLLHRPAHYRYGLSERQKGLLQGLMERD
jgi:hypothetical protein